MTEVKGFEKIDENHEKINDLKKELLGLNDELNN
jgi:hypothetical protein